MWVANFYIHSELKHFELAFNVSADNISQKNYREDWDYDKQLVYYPVHITPEYEAHVDVKKVQSDVSFEEHAFIIFHCFLIC